MNWQLTCLLCVYISSITLIYPMDPTPPPSRSLSQNAAYGMLKAEQVAALYLIIGKEGALKKCASSAEIIATHYDLDDATKRRMTNFGMYTLSSLESLGTAQNMKNIAEWIPGQPTIGKNVDVTASFCTAATYDRDVSKKILTEHAIMYGAGALIYMGLSEYDHLLKKIIALWENIPIPSDNESSELWEAQNKFLEQRLEYWKQKSIQGTFYIVPLILHYLTKN